MSEPFRDQLGDFRKAVESKIALHRSLGETPPEALFLRLDELDAREGKGKYAPTSNPVAELRPESAPEPEFEHKAEDAPDETAVPRKPGRPRKPSDDVSPSS